MAFIAKTDLLQAITADMLNAVVDNDDTIITRAADEAEAKMTDYLSARYDIDTIFAATGTDRHALALAYCVDIAIYTLWRFTDPLQVPALRVNAYKEAIEWLKGVMAGEIATTLPSTQASDESGGTLLFNSNEKRENQY